MSSLVEVRPFRRSDRDQLTQLVNAHAAAVVPGMGASVSAVLSSLERRPGEFIEDPWVSERVTLVAEQQYRIAAAAHLLRYFPMSEPGPRPATSGRSSGSFSGRRRPPGISTGRTRPRRRATDGRMPPSAAGVGCGAEEAGGELPVPGVYGTPDQWPHISALYERAGFAHTGHTEITHLARVATCPAHGMFRSRVWRSAGQPG